jgi:uncharacterized protein
MSTTVRIITLIGLLAAVVPAWAAGPKKNAVRTYAVSSRQVEAMERAAPDSPLVKPQKPRKVLVYGRVYTHPESVACCFKAMEILGRKTGAFAAVSSGDPRVFLPDNLRQYDAVVMNNTHERAPLLPERFDEMSPPDRDAAADREPVLKKSFLEFVASGKGLVGIHGATAGSVQWPEYLELFAAQYAGLQWAVGDLKADASPGTVPP